MKTRILLALAASLTLAACATAPKPLQGQFSTVSPRDSVAQKQTGTPVRWATQRRLRPSPNPSLMKSI